MAAPEKTTAFQEAFFFIPQITDFQEKTKNLPFLSNQFLKLLHSSTSCYFLDIPHDF
jgi:hypothetical protein